MKLKIERERLLKPLTQVSSVVERRQTLPILANVYLNLDKGQLQLIGTDLEVEVLTHIEDVAGEDGACTMTARKLLDICRALPDGAEVTLSADGERATIRSGKSRFSLQTLPAADFPKLETDQWQLQFRSNQAELKNLLGRTAFAMAQQDVRYYLNGLLFEVSQKTLRAVATDGHRLAKSEIEVHTNGDTELHQAIVPRKAVVELSRFLEEVEEDVTVELNPNHIRVQLGVLLFTSKVIDGRFPDYEKVIPQRLSTRLTVDRAEFQEVLGRAAILTNDKFRGVRLTFGANRMVVSANNPEQEEASDEMSIEYGGPDLEIGFNVNYLMDALKVLPKEHVELAVEDSNSSCTLQTPGDEKSQYLVMPMRL